MWPGEVGHRTERGGEEALAGWKGGGSLESPRAAIPTQERETGRAGACATLEFDSRSAEKEKGRLCSAGPRGSSGQAELEIFNPFLG